MGKDVTTVFGLWDKLTMHHHDEMDNLIYAVYGSKEVEKFKNKVTSRLKNGDSYEKAEEIYNEELQKFI